ncbi:MAG TPA: transcription-repair coupling factor [Polyangiaceae bacterium]|nr:transcription-repair coupling factor [Polyangiaceae bacterium]
MSPPDLNFEAPEFVPRLPEDRPIVTSADAARRVLGQVALSSFVGAAGSGPALVAHTLASQSARQVVYLAASNELAQKAAGDLGALTLGLPLARFSKLDLAPPHLLAAAESTPYAEVHTDRRAAMLRTSTLYELLSNPSRSRLVLTAGALVRRVPPRRALRDATIELVVEHELDVVALSRKLTASGYLRVPVVEDPGSYALRGGLIDIWPGQLPAPIRVELYGDLISSLRTFDPDDQRTLAPVERIVAPPARDSIVTDETEARARDLLRSLCDAVNYPSTKTRQLIDDLATGRAFFGSDGYLPAFFELETIFDYLAQDAIFVVDDPGTVVRAIRSELERGLAGEAARRGTPHFPARALYLSEQELEERLAQHALVALHRTAVAGPTAASLLDDLESAHQDAPSLAFSDLSDLARAVKSARTEHGKQGALEPLLERVRAYRDAGLDVIISARTETQAERLAALLSHRGVTVSVWRSGADSAAASQIRIVTASLTRGVLAAAEGFVLITEEEIFGPRAHRPAEKKRSARALLQDLRALSVGDFVVHVDHGVGKYLGLERRAIGTVHVDLLVVEYAGGDKLFLPIYRLNQIEKYAGGDTAPKLDRLGGQTFSKTKLRVERRVRQMADELLKLYAERAALKKDPLPPPDDEYQAFEASFPFEETRDQASAISEVLSDIQSDKVMDRLVCGDVGFGKTEVALRAAFFNAMAGRQVALLCPTTVLAQQHCNTFSARFGGYPLTVRAMSRFESKGEQQNTLKGLKEGSVDVVIGTHRLLSKDVHFKRLGLLVVDEEQRFGVTHKERIKQMRMSVDVLTLSATPIPRTLQLAVGGLRDMSIITTPPVDRRAIRTVVSQFDPGLVKEAILRELARGGQVFYVYNRVDGIYERAERIKALLPEARVAVGHGQMSESSLEQTMLDFVHGEYDVLVATAIIESGLDIPRANTIIVDRADLFGLSQLYQLRGRVGRANERAYAYLLVPPASQLSEEARSRIEALERYTELGSGFHIATLDMELRGAGDLLGAEQSGFVESVGFELFCKMLEDATHELRGETVTHEVDPDLNFDVEALLPEDYIAEVGVRLSLYKRLSSAGDEVEVNDLAREMEDRFGPPPLAARRLIELMRLKTELRRLRAVGCEATAKSATLHLLPDTPLDPHKVSALVAHKKSLYRISPDGRLTRRSGENEALSDGLVLADRMLSELAKCMKD